MVINPYEFIQDEDATVRGQTGEGMIPGHILCWLTHPGASFPHRLG